MFYKLSYDMDSIDELLKKGENYIYAEDNNLDEIEYDNIRKGRFHTVPLKQISFRNWPNVNFYYSSKVSERKGDFLLSSTNWPIVHEKVKKTLENNNIKGIEFFPICLIDVITNKMIDEYYFMYISRFIDAYDMKKSKFTYDENYNYYSFEPTQIYLDTKQCENEDIFRCIKNKTPIYVSEKLHQIILKNSFNGFYFTKQL